MRTVTTIYAEAAAHGVGNPYRNLAEDRAVTYPAREVRVVKDGWYGPQGQVVRVGERFKLPLPDAMGAVKRGLVEYIE